MKTLLCLISMAFLAGCSSDKSYNLTERLTAGDKWTMKMTMDEVIQGTYMTGHEGGETNSMTMWWDSEVLAVDSAGTNTTRTKYTRIAMNGWDSGDPNSVDTLGYAMMMGPMLSTVLTVTSDSRGHVLEVAGAEGSFGMGNPNVDDNAITANMIEMNTKWRPDGKVSLGETWEVDHATVYGYPMKYHTHYTLREVKDGIAYIDVESTMSPNPEAGPTWFGPTKVTQSLSGTQTGTIEVDMETGWAMKTTLEQAFSGTYDMEIDTAAASAMAEQMATMMEGMPMPEGGSEGSSSDMSSMMPTEPVKNKPMSATVKYTYEVAQ